MTHDEAEKFMKEQNQFLAEKGTLLLRVRVDSPEQVDEIMRWMYAEDKPIKAALLEIAWDKVLVNRDQAEALEVFRRTISP